MKIGGLQKMSLIDYPEKISAVVFTIGCNFLCPFCHNPELVKAANLPILSEEDFFEFLKKRQGILDGVCITGGEPMLHRDLPEFLKKIKHLGFAVKLDTNGTNPERLEKLIKENLIDYIAMDIKAPFEKYEKVIGAKVDLEKIKKSIDIIKKSGIDYEFRTTVVPSLHKKEDVLEIGKLLKGSKKYFLQQFRSEKTLNQSFKDEKSYSIEKLVEFSQAISPYLEYCGVRG